MCPSTLLLSFPPFHFTSLYHVCSKIIKHFKRNKHRSHQKWRSYNSPFSWSLSSSSRPKAYTSSIFICRTSGNPSSSSTFISHPSTVGCSDSGCTRQESLHQPTREYSTRWVNLKRGSKHTTSWCLLHHEYLDPTQYLHVNYLCTWDHILCLNQLQHLTQTRTFWQPPKNKLYMLQVLKPILSLYSMLM